MAKVKVTVTSSAKQAYYLAVLGARILKTLKGCFLWPEDDPEGKDQGHHDLYIRISVSSAMYAMIQMSDIGPLRLSWFIISPWKGMLVGTH